MRFDCSGIINLSIRESRKFHSALLIISHAQQHDFALWVTLYDGSSFIAAHLIYCWVIIIKKFFIFQIRASWSSAIIFPYTLSLATHLGSGCYSLLIISFAEVIYVVSYNVTTILIVIVACGNLRFLFFFITSTTVLKLIRKINGKCLPFEHEKKFQGI